MYAIPLYVIGKVCITSWGYAITLYLSNVTPGSAPYSNNDTIKVNAGYYA